MGYDPSVVNAWAQAYGAPAASTYSAPATTNYSNLGAGIGQDVLTKMRSTNMWDPSGGDGSTGQWGYEGGDPIYNSDPNGNPLQTTNQPRYLVYHPQGQGPGEQYPYFDPATGEFKGYRTGSGIQSYLSGILSVAGAGLGFGMVGGAAGAAGDAGGFVGEGAASGVPAWDAAASGATAGQVGAGTAAAGAVGGTGTGSAGGAAGGGLGSLTSGTGGQLATKVGLAGLSSALGGGGGSNGGIGNMSLADLANLAGGVYGAGQQGNAARDMLGWMNGQQAKIDNLYAPNSPEFNYLWHQMSATDAAAGRNSQYGPRAVDMAGKIAQIKADATARMTGALASPYSKALNQDASKYAGVTAPLGSLLSRAGGGLTLDKLLQGLGLGGSGGGVTPPNPYATDNTNWQDAVNSGQVQMPTDSWYNNPSDPTEEDVLSFMNRWGAM